METLACCRYRPWPDLPDPLLEIILERLPLSDYIRFSAVCRRWRSVQSSHRRRHSPASPPARRLPWLILDQRPHQETLPCYSPLEDRFFTVPLPFSPSYLQAFPCGWLLLSSDFSATDFYLFNPVSGAKIRLPPRVDLDELASECSIDVSPPPNYTVSFNEGSSNIFLLPWFNSSCFELKPPTGVMPRNEMVYCGGMHYYLCWAAGGFRNHDLLVVDALATPATIQYFEMAVLSQMPEGTGFRHGASRLVEFGKDPFLVLQIFKHEKNSRGVTVGFEVFRADLGRKMWVKVDNIGDRVLMLHGDCVISFLAVDVGVRGNCIYFSMGLRFREKGREAPWKMFDLGTGRVRDLPLPNASQIEIHPQQLFMPSLF